MVAAKLLRCPLVWNGSREMKMPRKTLWGFSLKLTKACERWAGRI